MPILNQKQIEDRIIAGQLILHPLQDSADNPVVEPASYDLRAGIVLWKDATTDQIIQKDFEETRQPLQQVVVTILPGQMVFVITCEELKLPTDISATVYSRNKLQKQNILALNAGHIDPGYEGPIIIRLINLGAIPWPLVLGDAVFTVVFHTVVPAETSKGHPPRSKQETLEAARKTAVEAFSNPFHDLYKNQIDKQLGQYYSEVESRLRAKFSNEFFRTDDVTRIVLLAAGVLVGGLAVVMKVPWGTVWNWIKSIF